MADRQREFLMAANHYRAGRITIDEFREKVLTATAGQVIVLTSTDGDCEQEKTATTQIEAAGASVVKHQFPSDGDLSEAKSLRESLRSAGAVIMLGLADLDGISWVAREAGCPVFIVPSETCKSNGVTALATELPPGVALLGKGQVASAAKLAASVARR